MLDIVLNFVHVTKSYPGPQRSTVILRDISFTVARGERVALFGPSGSGKTTILNLAAGLDDPDSGHIELHGESIAALPEPRRSLLRRRQLGFVFQRFNLLPQLNVAANIQAPLRLNRLHGPYWRDRYAALNQRLGLNHLLERLPEQLSGGEQQRVAIARALIHEPDLILADEPTGNLDNENAVEVLALLQEATQGRGLLLVTHSQQAAAITDQVLMVHNGLVEAVR